MTRLQFDNHSSKHEITGTKSSMLARKRIIIGLTGSVAVAEIVRLSRLLMRHGAEVFAVMTPAACELIQPALIEWATGNPVVSELTGQIEHVHLCGEHPEKADLLLIAPTTANTIGKVAAGIDDTPVTTFVTTALGTGIPVMIVPAMHATMYDNPIVIENIRKLKANGIHFIDPRMEEGKAKIASQEEILEYVAKILTPQTLAGKEVVVTAGPTRVWLDDVRFISNPSSGKTGIAIALEALRRGAKVTLIVGPTCELIPDVSITVKQVSTPEEVISAIDTLKTMDIYISSMAVSDYKPEKQKGKIQSKQKNLTLTLKPTVKIIDYVRKKYPEAFVVGFKAEASITATELEKRMAKSMQEHKIEMVVGNLVSGSKQAGFSSSINSVIIGRKGKQNITLKEKPKRIIASEILNLLLEQF